jgi:hypothetical protein
MVLNEDLCHALATMSRLDLELKTNACTLADNAAGAFVECLHQSDRGPVKLEKCKIGNQIITNALTGNSRVAKLKPYILNNDAEMVILFRALASNRGLVELDLRYHHISDDNWSILCESLKAHSVRRQR